MNRYTALLFSHPELLHEKFSQTDLGQLYLSIPFEQLASTIPPPPHSVSGLGCKPWLDVKGGIALQILKHYLQLSDASLMERINTDWAMQMFCGIQLKSGERIRDKNLPSFWRCYLGKQMDVGKMQKEFADFWKPYMQETSISKQDATCYESRIAHPTDIKLLWECCETEYGWMQEERRKLRLRKSRSNFGRQRKAFLLYQRNRKKTKRAEKKLRKRLLKYLLRLMELMNELVEKYDLKLSKKKIRKIKTLHKIYEQQHQRAYGNADEPIKDRIVSLSKPYIRPIVRGKEAKSVEFGAKVNKLMVDGIGFMEHISFDAFNETTRFDSAIYLHRQLFGKCTHHSADRIYATNKNRKYATSQNIFTNFIPKGKQKAEHSEQASIMRKLLTTNHTTVLEGSFGNEKNHYLLNKINARNQSTEVCWIFFGMMAANASIIANRIAEQTQHKARAA